MAKGEGEMAGGNRAPLGLPPALRAGEMPFPQALGIVSESRASESPDPAIGVGAVALTVIPLL